MAAGIFGDRERVVDGDASAGDEPTFPAPAAAAARLLLSASSPAKAVFSADAILPAIVIFLAECLRV